jgi:hypothetical protein
MEIRFTEHAMEKLAAREIPMDDLTKTIKCPDAENFLVISAFYDRRLLRGGIHD